MNSRTSRCSRTYYSKQYPPLNSHSRLHAHRSAAANEPEEEDDLGVIWLEGKLGDRLCWEDIDTGELVFERPTDGGTITNQTTLDNMMSEKQSDGTVRLFIK
jgi:hypothetical protein